MVLPILLGVGAVMAGVALLASSSDKDDKDKKGGRDKKPSRPVSEQAAVAALKAEISVVNSGLLLNLSDTEIDELARSLYLQAPYPQLSTGDLVSIDAITGFMTRRLSSALSTDRASPSFLSPAQIVEAYHEAPDVFLFDSILVEKDLSKRLKRAEETINILSWLQERIPALEAGQEPLSPEAISCLQHAVGLKPVPPSSPSPMLDALLSGLPPLLGLSLTTTIAAYKALSQQASKAATAPVTLSDALTVLTEPKHNPFRPPSVILLGAYNNGKSSLGNALVGEDDCFKVRDIPETKEIKRKSAHGMMFIDSPGLFAGGRPEDETTALSAAVEADVLLFLHDCTAGELDQEEITALQHLASSPDTSVHLVVTKIDEKRDQRDVQRIKDRILEQLSESGLNIPVSLTSSAWFKSPDFVEESGINALIAALQAQTATAHRATLRREKWNDAWKLVAQTTISQLAHQRDRSQKAIIEIQSLSSTLNQITSTANDLKTRRTKE
ncbi:GTPase domain-containing protein [Novispirillum itersonii]|uniref:GTP-binding protein EngB required for normal cell division n=1 Tax=Novispirillum itersonii TaxID=189 RepID=A0A7W9ZFM2_NOVIT|nr:GTPase domain-containing protein [Novispirillum itersonii]MBB6210223.1 GTP-binding protein EngB required for normal cell division [Novispirillum itersonii]